MMEDSIEQQISKQFAGFLSDKLTSLIRTDAEIVRQLDGLTSDQNLKLSEKDKQTGKYDSLNIVNSS